MISKNFYYIIAVPNDINYSVPAKPASIARKDYSLK